MELLLLSAIGVIPGVVTAIALVYLVARGIPQRRDSFSAVRAFLAYCYFMIGLSTISTVVGLVLLAIVGCKVAFLMDWTGNDLWIAFVIPTIGVLVCLLHLAAMRDVRKRTGEDLTTMRRVYVTAMAFLFGFASFVALTVAVFNLVDYYSAPIVPAPPVVEEAMAIVLVPVWLYYMSRLRSETRRKDTGYARSSDVKSAGSGSAPSETGGQVGGQQSGGQ